MDESQPFLLEIGTEELPPKNLAGLADALHSSILEQLKNNRLCPEKFSAGETYFSPRRLAIYLPQVLLKQRDRIEERLGPALSAAFDGEGRPTKAAEGFAKSCGVTVGQLQRKQTDKGERLACRLRLDGQSAAKLLPQIVAEALTKLSVPKRMRWGAGDTEFVRPVHWAVMLLGSRALKAEILAVRSSNKTYGHRYHHPSAIALKHPQDYRKVLATTGKVLVEDRAGTLVKAIAVLVTQAAKRAGGRAQLDTALLQEVAALVEWPVPITGRFDAKFLALPDEVIVAVLKTQQRYFPLRDSKDKLLPQFVAISNIQSRQPAEVRRGNERVIVPRLTDAMFFWDSDRRTRLESRSVELDRVVFQKELGSYGDKARRVTQLAAQIAKQIGGDPDSAERSARLSKCDLVTGMVREFPELQGTMGAYYARHDGESEAVAQAIAEHYRPRYAGDTLPVTQTGQTLAIADKLDTLAGIYATGQKPTGDKDPYGLRRAGLGLMRIIVECELDLDLAEFVRAALQLQPAQPRDPQALIREIYDFLMDRLRACFLEVGIRSDVYDAVRACNPGKPLEFQRRIQALNAFLALPEAASLATANKRIANILLQAGHAESRSVQATLLRAPAEIALHGRLVKLGGDARNLAHQGDYGSALKMLAALREPVDSFFDRVLVMDPDPALRNNRLALLQHIRDAFLRVADISLLQVE
ncbi:MAG: glycine--tRNA ligase subunit beta [Gammaproteobacteria bacterium]|nr:glycine--tRNA ligase subunit beta [Gammaproteobacteria bacterium]MDE2023269.1 glycine--tRNA ligase subunit beta [Gammaproteobacteria bacterium]